jgi:hypothetical protein
MDSQRAVVIERREKRVALTVIDFDSHYSEKRVLSEGLMCAGEEGEGEKSEGAIWL